MTALESSIESVRTAAAGADRMKAADIAAYDVSDLIGITDCMLLASATNERQVLAVAEEIEKDLYTKGGKLQPRGREGIQEAQWILLDYGDFIVHVMHEEARDFYHLERLWRDCPRIDLELPDMDAADADAA